MNIFRSTTSVAFLLLFAWTARAEPQCPPPEALTGAVVDLSPATAVSLVNGHYLQISLGGETQTFDLDVHIAPFEEGRLAALESEEQRRSIKVEPQEIALANGRRLAISHLFGSAFLLRVSAPDAAAFASFAAELERGSACGKPFSELTAGQIARLRPLVDYYLWDLMARGALDTFDPWLARLDILKTFTNANDRDVMFDVYSYRAAYKGKSDPALADTDPTRVSFFASRQLYLMLDPWPGAENLTDLSFDRQGDTISLRLFSMTPLEGGEFVAEHRFWTKLLTRQDIRTQPDIRATYEWDVRGQPFRARFDMSAVPPAQPAGDRFLPNFQSGVVVVDANFDAESVNSVVHEYAARFAKAGFVFGPKRASEHLLEDLQQEFADRTPDWVIRDGHGEFAHDLLFSVARKGFVQVATRVRDGQTQRIVVMFPDPREIRDDAPTNGVPVPTDLFRSWVEQAYATRGRPLVYVDFACWGVYKARTVLADLDPRALMFVVSMDTVNFMDGEARTGGKILLSAVLDGASFQSVRKKLASVDGRAFGEDRFILPDDPEHPVRQWRLRAHRTIERRTPDGEWRRYIPD